MPRRNCVNAGAGRSGSDRDQDGVHAGHERAGLGNTHFMSKPSAFAFGDGTLSTAHEQDQPTQGEQTPADFMGPSLWSSNEADFDAGGATHLDMLHNSPDAMGIAWDKGNAYWVFDGAHSSISRYDFAHDHGEGGQDHSDGVVARYVEGAVKRVAGVPSHMDLDHDSGLLYVADTGNNRLVVLDTSAGQKGAAVGPNYDGDVQYKEDGTELTTLVNGADFYLKAPSGLVLHDGKLFVSDHDSGEIQAFSLDGKALGFLDTGLPNSLMGIAFDPAGRLYVIDAAHDKVLRLTTPE